MTHEEVHYSAKDLLESLTYTSRNPGKRVGMHMKGIMLEVHQVGLG